MIDWPLHGTVAVSDGSLAVREVVGNVFGLASAVLGMRRVLWAWPVGLLGNVLLLTVFVSGELGAQSGGEPLWGQAGRQLMFVAVSLYGWWRCQRSGAAGTPAVTPRWATVHQRVTLLALAAAGYGAAYLLLREIGSWGPATEAWALAGSLLATFGMARGWVEFWLVWVLVDVVGVTSLVAAGYYPTAARYLFYGGFCVVGFATWWRAARHTAHPPDLAGSRPTREALA